MTATWHVRSQPIMVVEVVHAILSGYLCLPLLISVRLTRCWGKTCDVITVPFRLDLTCLAHESTPRLARACARQVAADARPADQRLRPAETCTCVSRGCYSACSAFTAAAANPHILYSNACYPSGSVTHATLEVKGLRPSAISARMVLVGLFLSNLCSADCLRHGALKRDENCWAAGSF